MNTIFYPTSTRTRRHDIKDGFWDCRLEREGDAEQGFFRHLPSSLLIFPRDLSLARFIHLLDHVYQVRPCHLLANICFKYTCLACSQTARTSSPLRPIHGIVLFLFKKIYTIGTASANYLGAEPIGAFQKFNTEKHIHRAFVRLSNRECLSREQGSPHIITTSGPLR